MNFEELQRHVMEWRQMFEEVYQVNLIDREEEFIYTFIFRVLGREEYKELLYEDMEQGAFQEVICEAAILYPEGYDFSEGLAGIAEVLSDTILETSGLHMGQAKNILDMFREQMLVYDYQADCIIHEAFPEYTIEEIQSWSNRKTMYFLSRAEWVLTELRGVPLVPLDQQVAQDMQQIQEHQAQQDGQAFDHNFTSDGPPKYVSQEEMPPEFQDQFEQEPAAKHEPNAPEDNPQSEEELLAMLGQQAPVNKPSNKMQEKYPEMAWFKAEEELKGNFD